MKREVLRKARRDINSAFNRHVDSRRGHFEEIPSGPTSTLPTTPPTIKTAVEITYTFNLSNFSDFSQNASSAFKKGYNSAKWIDATRARITARGGSQAEIDETTTPGSVSFNGESVLDFLACGWDIVSLGHSAPKEHIAEIRSRANKDIEVLHQLIDYESIAQNSPYNQLLDGMYNLSKANYLVSDPTSGMDNDGLNGYGCDALDVYEALDRSGSYPNWVWTPANVVGCPPGQPGTFSKHSWQVDVTTPGYADNWSAIILSDQEAWIQNFITGGVWMTEGIVIDNILNAPLVVPALTNAYPAGYAAGYLGSAPPPPQTGGTGMKGMLARIQYLAQSDARGKWKVWGNAPDSEATYSAAELAHRFVEHWFRKNTGSFVKRTLADLQASMDATCGQGIRINVGGLDGPGSITGWFTSSGPGSVYGTWAELQTHVNGNGYRDLFYAQAGRATSGGYLFWQPEFEEPA